MDKAAENTFLGKQVASRKRTMESQNASADIRENSKKESEYRDILLTEQLAKQDTVIDSDCIAVIKADSPEQIYKAEKELRQNYKDDGKTGLMLIRRTAHQMDTLKNIFHTTSADAWHNSDVTRIASTRMFFPSSGFADKYAAYCGYDIHAFADENASLIDFYGVRNAVIITGGTPVNVSIGGREHPVLIGNAGSAWGHVISDPNYVTAGNRNHHIMLVPFGGFHNPNAKIFNMAKETINTLEVFGTRETVERDTNNNIDKVTEIVMMLLGNKQQDPAIRALLQSQLIDWLIYRARGTGMYTARPSEEPTKAWRILATRKHDNYPTLQGFITELQTMVNREARKGELAREKADMLLNSVRSASRRYPQVFSAHTSIPDDLGFYDRNIYYDLSDITDDRMVKGAIFLNTLAYAINRANEGDEIIVHGIDTIAINPDVLKHYREQLNAKGVGLITTFEQRDNAEMNIKTLNSFVEPLASQDVVVLGGITGGMLDQIEQSWGRQLPHQVREDLVTDRSDSRFYVYRRRDMGSAVIDTHLILIGGGKYN